MGGRDMLLANQDPLLCSQFQVDPDDLEAVFHGVHSYPRWFLFRQAPHHVLCPFSVAVR